MTGMKGRDAHGFNVAAGQWTRYAGPAARRLGPLAERAGQHVQRVGGKPLVVQADQLIDGSGRPPVRDGAVAVVGGRIVFSGPSTDCPSLPGATAYRFSGASLLPGFIDAHVHFTGDITADIYRRFLDPPQLVRPLIAAAHAAITLGAGFTTVRDLGLPGASTALRDAILSGSALGPRIVTAVTAIGQTGGHADWHAFPESWVVRSSFPRGDLADGVDRGRRAVRLRHRERADVIKLFLESGGVTNTPDDLLARPEFSAAELRGLIEESRRRGLPIAVHAKQGDVVRRAVALGVSTVEHADLDADDLDTFGHMASKNVILVPTLSLYHWVGRQGRRWGISEEGCSAARSLLPRRQAMVRAARVAGVKVAAGTDTGGTFGLGMNGTEMALLAECGLSASEAIQAGTRIAAEAVGLSEVLGTLEPGKLADLVVVRGDPLASIGILANPRNVIAVFTTASLGGTASTPSRMASHAC
jgi:imidazolonepropionase-like amidohydrolase